jgi:hypothetical protein
MSVEITKVPGNISSSISMPVEKLYGTTPTIYNLSAPTANTEVSQALPVNTKKLLIRCRGDARTQFAFVSGQSGSNYITIPIGAMYAQDLLLLSSTTVYLQTSLSSQTIEILIWT